MKKKILGMSLLSVFAFSMVISANAASSVSSSGKAASMRIVPECVRNAVNAREESLISAHETFSVNIKTAFQTRKDALFLAWSKINAKEIQTAVKSAWDNFKTSSKNAGKSLQDSKKSAWLTFETARNNCKNSADKAGLNEEKKGKGIDMSIFKF